MTKKGNEMTKIVDTLIVAALLMANVPALSDIPFLDEGDAGGTAFEKAVPPDPLRKTFGDLIKQYP